MSRDEAAELAAPTGQVMGTAHCRLRRTPQLRGGPDGLDILLTAIRWRADYPPPQWWETPTYVLRFADGEELEGFFARWPAEAGRREEHRFYPQPTLEGGWATGHRRQGGMP